jgi:predicted RNA-binding protein with RPS1 domain
MLAVGQIVEVEVTKSEVFGLFCHYQGDELLVLIPEISWTASFCSCKQVAVPGDRITVKIIHTDSASGKISASMKAIYPDPWADGRLVAGNRYDARVVRRVEQADRCDNRPGYLMELFPGAYAMWCAEGVSLESNQRCEVVIQEANFSRRSVKLVC